MQMEKLFVLKEISNIARVRLPLDVEWLWVKEQIDQLFAEGAIDLMPITGSGYTATAKGRGAVKNALAQKSQIIRQSEVFAFVDPERGEFAHNRYYELMKQSQTAWEFYLSESRWIDLRLAVCEFRHPEKIEEWIFLTDFFDEKPTVRKDWQMWVGSGELKREVENLAKNFISWRALGEVEDEEIIKDIIRQGEKLTLTLI